MDPKPTWMQGPSNVLGIHVDFALLHARLQAMSDAELLAFGKQMHGLVYPLTYDGDGKPQASDCSIQLEEASAAWRRRKQLQSKRIG